MQGRRIAKIYIHPNLSVSRVPGMYTTLCPRGIFTVIEIVVL